MDTQWTRNGLLFWNEDDLRVRGFLEATFEADVKRMLLEMNKAWTFHRFESPVLMPPDKMNKNYTEDDVFFVAGDADLVLSPETTPASYEIAETLMNRPHNVRPPFVVWQTRKSFRNESDQPLKHMRLKEFHQQEFQCLYAVGTANDYHAEVLDPLCRMFQRALRMECRVVESDRLPDYSETTMDIEVWTGKKWMELASISRRTDFEATCTIDTKKGRKELELLVLEIAIGLDRCVYAYNQWDQSMMSLSGMKKS